MAKKNYRKVEKVVTCQVKECRKRVVEGSDLCRDHQNPMDVVPRLTEVELLKLGKLNSDMQVALLNAKMTAIDGRELRARAESEIQKKEEERQAFMNEARQLKNSYDAFTAVLATKYGIDDPSKMIVDPDTGVIRDLSHI